jgi:hypothetical protein
MKKLAFIATVLVAIAPIAEAQPWRGDRYDQHQYEGQRAMVPLVSMDIHRKETVDIGRQAGRFHGLRIEARRGAAYINFVEVRYGNGEQQHFDVHRRIGRGEIVDVPFDGQMRYVEAITVHGQPDRWSQIQVLGMR